MRSLGFASLVSSSLLAVAAAAPFLREALPSVTVTPVAVGSAVFLLTLLGNIKFIESRERFLRQRQRRLLDLVCKDAIEDLRSLDETARLNIMTIRWSWFRRRFEYFQPYFMDPSDDMRLKIGPGQGVAGSAWEHKSWAVGDREKDIIFLWDGTRYKDADRGMYDSQRKMVGDLKLIYSYPIRRLEYLENADINVAVGKVIGVVNIDSSVDGAFEFYVAQGLHGQLLRDVLPKMARNAADILG